MKPYGWRTIPSGSPGGSTIPLPGVDLARSFNGTSDKITIGGGFSLPTTFTISSWINDGGGGSARSFFGGSASGSIEFRVNGASSKLELLACAVASIGTSTGTITASVWTQVVVTYDGTNFAFYIGGSASGSGSNAQSISAPANYVIGDCSAVGDFYNGSVADPAVWNTILTGTQITSLANGQRANTVGANANLIGYWPILGQSPEPDRSGNGNNGTLTGTAIVAGPPQLALF